MSERTVNTYCRICLAGCGLEVKVDADANRVVSIEPDRQNPYTWRDFCRKGKMAAEVAEHPRRLMTPMRRVGDSYEPASYEEAIADIAARLNAIIDRHGPDAVGSYHGNPMGFTFANTTFWTGLLDAIGTGNRFWVGSIDQNNSHVVAEQMYGFELVALPPDIDECDCFLLVGMDPAVSKFNWMDNNPDGWNRILARQRAGADVIVVDPRRSATAARAGTHVALLPGTDWAFLLGVIKVIFDEQLEKLSTVVGCNGVQTIRELATQADLGDLAERCGVEAAQIEDVARRFARARTAMCVTHTGVSHNEHGTIGEWLGHVLNLLTDRTDRPGGRRFERGFVDMAKIMSLFAPSTKHRTRLRDLPTIVGFHALAELPDEILTPGPGQIRALLMAFGNPVVSGPDGRALDAALSKLDLLIAVDLVQRESHRHADWLIPGTHWLEREELSPLFANLQEQPYVQYAHQAIRPPAGIMEEWEFFTELALAMNRNLFGKPGLNRFVRASRRLAERTGRPKLAMNPEWVGRLMVAMGRRIKWKDILAHPHGWVFGEKTYGHLPETVLTDDRRVQLAPPMFVLELQRLLDAPPARSTEYPLLLTNKRVRESMNSWLNESPGLFKLRRENVVEVHPDDAGALGVADGDLVRLSSQVGAVEVAAAISDAVRPGVVCIPHGWGTRTFDPLGGRAPEGFGVNRNLLVDGQRIDRFSQTPAFNSTAVRLELVAAAPSVSSGGPDAISEAAEPVASS
jgi:formate dehydrogenase